MRALIKHLSSFGKGRSRSCSDFQEPGQPCPWVPFAIFQGPVILRAATLHLFLVDDTSIAHRDKPQFLLLLLLSSRRQCRRVSSEMLSPWPSWPWGTNQRQTGSWAMFSNGQSSDRLDDSGPRPDKNTQPFNSPSTCARERNETKIWRPSDDRMPIMPRLRPPRNMGKLVIGEAPSPLTPIPSPTFVVSSHRGHRVKKKWRETRQAVTAVCSRTDDANPPTLHQEGEAFLHSVSNKKTPCSTVPRATISSSKCWRPWTSLSQLHISRSVARARGWPLISSPSTRRHIASHLPALITCGLPSRSEWRGEVRGESPNCDIISAPSYHAQHEPIPTPRIEMDGSGVHRGPS